jgi:hypothetical protein
MSILLDDKQNQFQIVHFLREKVSLTYRIPVPVRYDSQEVAFIMENMRTARRTGTYIEQKELNTSNNKYP